MSWLRSLNKACEAALRWLSANPARALAALTILCLTLYIPGQASLPVTDRDEARFAQATKQMLETGDFIDIRFQDAPRYKKPIGIHWLQSISVSMFGNNERNNIWAYRIPSLIGIIAAVLLTWWAARPIFGPRVALLAAALLASAVTVSFESRIAKSDAVLLAFTVLAQGALARIYLFNGNKRSEMVGIAAVFWIALGLGILIKGPVAPLVLGLTVAALLIFGGERGWKKNLHAAWGIPVMLTVTLPWFIAIGVISGGEFFKGAVGKDFLAKLIGGEEKHGAPPGYYLVAFWWSFWPGALIATGGAALWLWRHRIERRALWLLASIIPFWLVVEIVPTKLPHYILPVYPAIAMAAAWILCEKTLNRGVPMRTYKQSAALFMLVTALQIGALGYGLWLFEAEIRPVYMIAAVILTGLALIAAYAAWHALFYAALTLGIASAALLYLMAFPRILPGLEPVWPALRAAEAVAPLKRCVPGPVAFVGYNEPSAVFWNGTQSKLALPAQGAMLLARNEVPYVFVAAKRAEAFRASLRELGVSLPEPLACADGIDINGGGVLNFKLYSMRPKSEFSACAVAERYRCKERPPARWETLLGPKKS